MLPKQRTLFKATQLTSAQQGLSPSFPGFCNAPVSSTQLAVHVESEWVDIGLFLKISADFAEQSNKELKATDFKVLWFKSQIVFYIVFYCNTICFVFFFVFSCLLSFQAIIQFFPPENSTVCRS